MCYGIELKKGMVNRLECTKNNDVPSKKILNIFAHIPIIRGGGGGGGERGSSQC